MKAGPTVPLVEVFRHRKGLIIINDTRQYKRRQVQLRAVRGRVQQFSLALQELGG